MKFIERLDFQLILFVLFTAILFFFALNFKPLLDFLYAINKSFYSGYSLGKLIVTFSWFILCSLIVAIGYFFKLYKIFERFEKAFLVCFIIVISFGFYLGAYQFIMFGVNYKPRWMFASIVYEPNYKNWEASKLYHNHFPKATLYYASRLLGIDFGQKFDDGRPWFEVLPDAELYSMIYLGVILISIILLLKYLFAISKTISLFDYIILSAASLGFFIYIIDGGIAAAPISSIFFLFFLFITRRYCSFCKNHITKALFALTLTFAANYFSVAIFDYYVPVSNFQLGLVFFMAFAYMAFFAAKELFCKIRTKCEARSIKQDSGLLDLFLENKKEIAVFIVTFILFYFSYLEIEKTLIPYMNGKILVDYSKIYSDIEKGAGIFIYGLPEEVSEEALKQELSNFGVVMELNKTGWTAFAKIMPNGIVTDKEVAEHLIKKFNPKTYLYADETALRATYEPIYIYWEEPTDVNKYVRDRFNDIEVIKRFNEGNRSIILVKAYAGPTWQLLSVLTEIKENGYKGKVIVAK